ncbi:MAG: chemotaxis protein CheW [Thermodesulfobacteriota bacterium]|nr:chemotaxis protein CheW [Thermodesulfobacteriota bacterium]
MSLTTGAKTNSKSVELATFYVGEALCGMDILGIQEINKLFEITPVPGAPEYITGILNLRGLIVTIIDLGKKLGISSTGTGDDSRNIVVNSRGEHVGLLVERISDVVQADWDDVEPPPANIGGVQGKYFKGVLKTEKSLIGILDVEEVLSI